MRKTKLLFVCTGNGTVARRRRTSSETRKSTKQDPPARALFAVRRVTQELIDWADQIFVMSELDDGHLTFLETHFNLKGKAVYDRRPPGDGHRFAHPRN
jgi:predicted protein tyrosine phosphatase